MSIYDDLPCSCQFFFGMVIFFTVASSNLANCGMCPSMACLHLHCPLGISHIVIATSPSLLTILRCRCCFNFDYSKDPGVDNGVVDNPSASRVVAFFARGQRHNSYESEELGNPMPHPLLPSVVTNMFMILAGTYHHVEILPTIAQDQVCAFAWTLPLWTSQLSLLMSQLHPWLPQASFAPTLQRWRLEIFPIAKFFLVSVYVVISLQNISVSVSMLHMIIWTPLSKLLWTFVNVGCMSTTSSFNRSTTKAIYQGPSTYWNRRVQVQVHNPKSWFPMVTQVQPFLWHGYYLLSPISKSRVSIDALPHM